MARREEVTTGRSKRSAKRRRDSTAFSLQPLPPTMTMGCLAAQSSFCKSAIWVWPGHVGTGSTRAASLTLARSTSMSSGRAITTGPGRPCKATWKARETISGMRATSSISTTHLAKEPKTAR